MKKIHSFFLIFIACTNILVAVAQQTAKPPLGYNSWDSYGKFPTEKAMLANIDAFVKKLKPFGYEYFVIDAGWNIEKDANNKITHHAIDDYSRYISAKSAFPRGIKYIADKAHENGLKFGIHVMRGIPRRAYYDNLKILGTNYTARNIADTNSKCTWNNDNFGVDMSKPGAQEYYDSYIGQLIDWGVDFIKADDITGHPAEIDAIMGAITKKGKKVILSLSPGEGAAIENTPTYNKATMLRVTKDIWDNSVSIDRSFAAWKKWNKVEDRKFWLDMDMIPFGHLCLHNPNHGYLLKNTKGEGEKNVRGLERMSDFTTDEKYSFITLRALSASPLMMGGDLPTSDKFSFDLITNREILACNQNGIVGQLIYEKGDIEIWKTVSKNNPQKGWIGIFNRSKRDSKKVQIFPETLGLKNTTTLFDVWNRKSLGKVSLKKKLDIKPGSVLFIKY